MKPIRSYFLVLACLCFHTFVANAQWTQVNTGLTDIRVSALAVSGTDLFAATEGSGVFRSTNNGVSWTPVNTGLTNLLVYTLTVSTAGGGSGTNLFAGTSDGVFLSTNLGASWIAKNTSIEGLRVNALTVSGGALIAGTWRKGGVYYSTNDGTSWIAASTGVTNWVVWSLAVSGTKIFAGNGDVGVYLSTDNGVNWSASNDGLTSANVLALAVSGTNLFAGTLRGGVFRSTDNGKSWTAVNAGLTNMSVRALVVSPNGPGGMNLFAGTDDGVFRSTDNGASWTASNSGLTYTNVRALVVTPNPLGSTNLFAGTFAGVWKCTLSDWTYLLAPADRVGGITSHATFTWKRDQRASSYTFQLSSTPGFENLVMNQNMAETTYTVSNLQLCTAYYWRVRSENTTWASEWGSAQFTTKLTGPPQLLSPTAGVLASLTPTLSWTPVVSTAMYTVQLSFRSAFDAVVYSKEISSPSVTLPQLEGSTLYYWRVRAQTAGDTTAWSDGGFFGTLPNVPGAITLVYPDSGKQDVFQNDWLMWQTSTTALTYTVQLATTPLFTEIFDSVTTSGTGYRSPIKRFAAGTTYFWRVRGSNWGGDGQFSPVWSFRTGSDVRKAFALCSPQSIEFGRVKVGQFNDSVVTIANNGNDTLKIQSFLSSDGAFSVRPASATIPPGGSLSFETIRFAPASGGTVNASIAMNSNALTSPDSIRVSGFGLSYGLRLSSIKVDVGRVLPGMCRDTTITIENTGSDTLKITGMSTSAQGITIRPVSCSIPPGGLATDTIRFAEVIPGPVSGSIIITSNAPSSPDSVQINAFGATAVTEVTNEVGIPNVFSLSQNYPNPFNPSTNIRFSVAQAGHVSLKIFNVLGVEVATLVDEQKEAGAFSVHWNAAGLSSGVYLYHVAVTSGQGRLFSDVKRLVLLK